MHSREAGQVRECGSPHKGTPVESLPEDFCKARRDSSFARELREGSLEEVACALALEDQNDLQRGRAGAGAVPEGRGRESETPAESQARCGQRGCAGRG